MYLSQHSAATAGKLNQLAEFLVFHACVFYLLYDIVRYWTKFTMLFSVYNVTTEGVSVGILVQCLVRKKTGRQTDGGCLS